MTATYEHFKLALITGGGGGLGKVMAHNLIEHGKQVIIAGRTESNLIEAQKELGSACIAYYVVDVGKTETLANFAQKVISEHPTLDCLFNNAGVSDAHDFKAAPTTGIDGITELISINMTSLTILCYLFSTHLQAQSSAVLVNLSSGLGYVPMSAFPTYCATKAYVASFTRSLRVQLKDTNVRVIEICPPLVDSNIMRKVPNASDFNSASNPNALTQQQFIQEVQAGLATDNVEIGVGTAGDRLKIWQDSFGPYWRRVNQVK